MSWRTSVIDGPISIPVYGPEEAITDIHGLPCTHRPVIGTVPGYHLNVAPQIVTADMGDYVVNTEPATPARVFAGAPTAFLRFADEAEARAVLAAYWTAE